jgi:fumarate reductase flavoprotein subunit
MKRVAAQVPVSRARPRPTAASFDVLVVGGGIAGWTAARRAQQLGARVALVEKGAEGPGASSSVLSGGTIHAAYLNPRTSAPEDLYRRIIDRTDGHARPDVARAWAWNVRRAVSFLASEGAEFQSLGPAQYQQTGLRPALPKPPSPADYWRGGGAERLLTAMWRAFVDEGATFLPGTRAVELSARAGRVTGAFVVRGEMSRELLTAPAVILADGGFQGSPELMARYVTDRQGRYINIGSANDTGDGLRMALGVGARAVEMDAFYGTISFRDALTIDALRFRRAPSPMPLLNESMVVNGDGLRIGDEGLGSEEWAAIDTPLAIPILRTPAPGDSWMVFDHDVWETVGRGMDRERVGATGTEPTGLNPYLLEAGGTLLTAPTLEGMAREMSVPIEPFLATARAFNQFCIDGTPLDPPRASRAKPIVRAPFHAIPLITGIFYMMGGTLVDGSFQVLDEREQPIAGLYAAGGTMGGLDGGPRNGYAGGWSGAATSGLVAAEAAVAGLRGDL